MHVVYIGGNFESSARFAPTSLDSNEAPTRRQVEKETGDGGGGRGLLGKEPRKEALTARGWHLQCPEDLYSDPSIRTLQSAAAIRYRESSLSQETHSQSRISKPTWFRLCSCFCSGQTAGGAYIIYRHTGILPNLPNDCFAIKL
jgi:hypothetical protein